jgi:adenine-specific DNA methylase
MAESYQSPCCHQATDGAYGEVRRGSGEDSGLKSRSIDLILTDPPYFDNLNYGEMADFYYAWLRPVLSQDYPQEFAPPDCVTIKERIHGNGDEDAVSRFTDGLTRVFVECRRVLKRSGLMALTFHHRKREPWQALFAALLEAGFAVVQVTPVRSEGRSGFHSSPGNLKWDLVIVCRPTSQAPSASNAVGFDPEQTLDQWKQDLKDVEGGPSKDDWRNLEMALSCLRNHRGNRPRSRRAGVSRAVRSPERR